MRSSLVALILCVATIARSTAQDLKPGFDADEYATMLRIMTWQVDAAFRGTTPKETAYKWIYRSPAMGLHNKWDLWLNTNKTTIIVNLRGTTFDTDSWLENFFSAMVPATGSLKLDSNYTFNYKLAADPKAMVHVGWLIGAGSMAPDIVARIKEYYGRGVKQVIVVGHSQGGALAFLITSHLHYLMENGGLPADIVIKSYCSAAPKPGNLYYAYDFDYITRGGWALTVVNAADWVPETPVSIQTPSDFNKLNPFNPAGQQTQKMKRVERWALKYAYGRLAKTSRKAQRKQEKYLGRVVFKQVKKYMPGLEKPKFAHCNNYMRAGLPIVLQPDAEYYAKYPDTGSNVFRHHLFEPYYYLVKKIYK